MRGESKEVLMPGQRFAGRVALVTGAGRGMGRATALRLAAEGACVIVNDINGAAAERVAEEIRRAGGTAYAIAADVADELQVQEMIRTAVELFGTLHILVNNAGILRTTHPLEKISVAEWEGVMAVNVRGTFLCMKYALPIMKRQRYGRVINLASVAGRSTSTFGGAHYTCAKAAVLGLTRHAAREAAPFGITVNAVAPGTMDTEMIREVASPESLARAVAAIPMGRMGKPEEEASLVAFLASDEASFITGATVDINGGALMI